MANGMEVLKSLDSNYAVNLIVRINVNLGIFETMYDDWRCSRSPIYKLSVGEFTQYFVDRVGYVDAVEVVATLVNYCAWDDLRISCDVAEWASFCDIAWDREVGHLFFYFTDPLPANFICLVAKCLMIMGGD